MLESSWLATSARKAQASVGFTELTVLLYSATGGRKVNSVVALSGVVS